MGNREVDVRDAAIEVLVAATAQLWRVVLGAEAASPSSRASLAMVATGLARTLHDLTEAISIVLIEHQPPAKQATGDPSREP